MIGIKVNGQYLDLDKDQKIGLEINNPFFDHDTISGTLTYPFSVNFGSRNNRKILGWPDRPGNQLATTDWEDCELYIGGALFKTGVMKYRGQSNNVGSYNFQSDAGDFSNKADGVRLRELGLDYLDLETNAIMGVYPDYDYTFFPVKNVKFYGDKNTDYSGYQNYYDDGFPSNSVNLSRHNLTPFFYLVSVLEKVFAKYGYAVSGDWLNDVDIRKICIHSNYALDKITGNVNVYADMIRMADHLPDMTVNGFLIAIKKLFGVGYVYDAIRKEVKIIRLKDVLANRSYVNWTKKCTEGYDDTPVDYTGYRLKMTQDSTDELMESLGNDWLKYTVDRGGESYEVNASPMHMYQGLDEVNGLRHWTVPQINQAGSSKEFEIGVNLHPMRLMYYHGLDGYPKASYEGANLDLRWSGTKGLYEQCHADWLLFLSKGPTIKRKIALNIVDLMNLDPTQIIMMENLKYLWKKVSLTVSTDRLEVANVTLMKK